MKRATLAVFFALACSAVAGAAQPGVVTEEFIFETASFPSCHASTIVEVPGKHGGLVAAWFGGTREADPDVGIWLSRYRDGKWSAPVEVADGVAADATRLACFNPVLFQPPGQPLVLFYKVGKNARHWRGFQKTSTDEGATWSKAAPITPPLVGPVKNKPVLLADGSIVSGSSAERNGWRVHFERSTDGGKTWQFIGPVNDGQQIAAVQPTILLLGGDKLKALARTQQGKIAEVSSADGGKSWCPMTLTALPNPNSGIDAVTLKDGRHLLVYNHSAKGRSPLNVAVSKDGVAWEAALVLEDEPDHEFSYPAVIQAQDGLVHITYTWKRKRIKHVVLDPAKVQTRPLKEEANPAE